MSFQRLLHARKIRETRVLQTFFYQQKVLWSFIHTKIYLSHMWQNSFNAAIFLHSYFQYSALDILNILYELYHSGISLEKLVKKTKECLPFIERRHINFYRRRIIRNRKLIQYVLNLMSPEFIFTGNIPENQVWVKKFLEIVYIIHTTAFLVDFSKLTGKSFMTSQYVAV